MDTAAAEHLRTDRPGRWPRREVAALGLISKRGANRGRDLLEDFDALR